MSDYTKLEVWQKAYKLTIDIYRLTQFFPNDELYGLTAGSSLYSGKFG